MNFASTPKAGVGRSTSESLGPKTIPGMMPSALPYTSRSTGAGGERRAGPLNLFGECGCCDGDGDDGREDAHSGVLRPNVETLRSLTGGRRARVACCCTPKGQTTRLSPWLVRYARSRSAIRFPTDRLPERSQATKSSSAGCGAASSASTASSGYERREQAVRGTPDHLVAALFRRAPRRERGS